MFSFSLLVGWFVCLSVRARLLKRLWVNFRRKMVIPQLTTFDPEDKGELIQGLDFHKQKFQKGRPGLFTVRSDHVLIFSMISSTLFSIRKIIFMIHFTGCGQMTLVSS